MGSGNDRVRVIRAHLRDAHALCTALGLLSDPAGWRHQARGVIIRCPWHEDRTPSCSVRLADDGTIGCVCYACHKGGDALSLIAAARGLNMRSDFREVLRVAASFANLHELAAELAGGPESGPLPVAPVTKPAPETNYPSERSIGDLLELTTPTTEDDEVASWLVRRGLDPQRIDALDLARALPRSASVLPRWAYWHGSSWATLGHRLIVPVRDANGVARSVRAGRVTVGESPKRLPPGGHRAHGLVMADAVAVAMFTGRRKPTKLLVIEGEPDYLTHASRGYGLDIAIVGLVSGAWTAGLAARVPTGTRVVVRTDSDLAGDRYAEEVAKTLRGRCVVLRLRTEA